MSLKFILSVLVWIFSQNVQSTTTNQPDVMWYSGSFDPPTYGHIEIVKDIASRSNGPLYITVNHNTGKNFNASIRERIEMLKLAFKDSPNIHIIREPIEGRRAFVEKLNKRHKANVVLAVGEDVLEKNYNMLGDLKELSFLSFGRPGQESDYVPNGTSKVYKEIHPLNGMSSTAVRDSILAGDSTKHLLLPGVEEYIKKNKLYKPSTSGQEELFKSFIKIVKESLPQIDLSKIPSFEFKSTQSLAGQKDAMIRWLLTHENIPDKSYGFYIQLLESKLNEKYIPLSFNSDSTLLSEEQILRKTNYYRRKYNANISFPLKTMSSDDFADYISYHLIKEKGINLDKASLKKGSTPMIWDSRKDILDFRKFSHDTFFVTICNIIEDNCFFALPENAKYADGKPVPKEFTLYDHKIAGRGEKTPHRQMMEHLGLWSHDRPIWEQNKVYRGGGFKITREGIEIGTTSGQLNRSYDGYPNKKMSPDDTRIFKRIVNHNIRVQSHSCMNSALKKLIISGKEVFRP